MGPENRILLVDDDDPVRVLIQIVLRRRGFTVEGARNGIEAMQKIRARRYPLVLLDLMMPQMSGYAVLEELGVMEPADRPCVILLTAGVPPRPADLSIVAGVIEKPFDIDLLVEMVSRLTAGGFVVPGSPDCQSRRRGSPAADKLN